MQIMLWGGTTLVPLKVNVTNIVVKDTQISVRLLEESLLHAHVPFKS